MEALHREVDELVAELAVFHGYALRCGRGCTDCCVDDITVFEVEAELIPRDHGGHLHSKIHPKGMCAFLADDGACRIYDVRPYVCRTQGLPLRWLDEVESGELVERRDICPLNDEGLRLLELSEEQCWTLGPFEGRLAQLQASVDGGELRRVSLRALPTV